MTRRRPETDRRIARHEAAHFRAGMHFRRGAQRISCDPSGNTDGHMYGRALPIERGSSRDAILRAAIVCLAGPVAEAWGRGGPGRIRWVRGSQDFDDATKSIDCLPRGERDGAWREAWERTFSFVAEFIDEIDVIADVLLVRRRLNLAEVRAILDEMTQRRDRAQVAA